MTKDGPTRRVLAILDLVGREGPLRLADLTARLDFSRAAIWRGLDVLREEGWVRMRSGDNAYELTHDRAEAMGAVHGAFAGADEMAAFLQAAHAALPIHAKLGGFRATGAFQIIESTDKADYRLGPASLVSDPMAIAGHLNLDPVQTLRHLKRFEAFCSDDDRAVIQTGAHLAELRRLQERGIVLAHDHAMLSLPCQCAGAHGFSIGFAPNGVEKLDSDSVMNWARRHFSAQNWQIVWPNLAEFSG